MRTIAFALLIYGVTTLAHGSGFLAVLLAGILVGDTRAPYKREIEHFASGLASLAEIVAFTILGLSIPLTTAIGHGRGWTALGIAALLALVVRPVLVGLVLWPVKLRLGERAFVLWAGLKGVVPILLGTYIVAEHEPGAERLYSIIFVTVLLSVVVQGGLVPALARAWQIPMRVVDPEPWAMGMRFRDRPEGLQRYVVEPGSRAAGTTLRDLPLDEDVWVSVVSRAGSMVRVNGATMLEPGDEVLAITAHAALARGSSVPDDPRSRHLRRRLGDRIECRGPVANAALTIADRRWAGQRAAAATMVAACVASMTMSGRRVRGPEPPVGTPWARGRTPQNRTMARVRA